MANEEQLAILRQGVKVWNKWREKNHSLKIDLNGANLSEAILCDIDLGGITIRDSNFIGADLRRANFRGSDLKGSDLRNTDLRETILIGTNLRETNLAHANLENADLADANLYKANLWNANLTSTNLLQTNLEGADLRESSLVYANLVRANINAAKVSGSSVYGINVWDLKGRFEEQRDLRINRKYETLITVDNIKVSQFIYLILNNEEIRDALNTLTSKSVLILGRFAISERKAILDALRNKLREYDLLPIVFDFDRPTDKDFTETIKTLAGISYFVIADITNPKSSPLELQAVVPDYQIPFVPIIQEGESPFAMMVDLQKKYPWVLPTRSYDSIETLMSALKPGIIDPAVEMRNKLRLVKAQEQVTESLRDYVDKTL